MEKALLKKSRFQAEKNIVDMIAKGKEDGEVKVEIGTVIMAVMDDVFDNRCVSGIISEDKKLKLISDIMYLLNLTGTYVLDYPLMTKGNLEKDMSSFKTIYMKERFQEIYSLYKSKKMC